MPSINLPLVTRLDASHPPGWIIEGTVEKLLFDDTTEEFVFYQFRLPPDYVSTPLLKIQYSMKTATSGSLSFNGAVMSISPGAAADVDSESFDTVNEAHGTVPATAGYVAEVTLDLTNNDGMSSGDLVFLKLSRNATDATNDTATGDAEVLAVQFQYLDS